MFVELEFSTLENLLVKKQKLEIKEDNFSFQHIKSRYYRDFFLKQINKIMPPKTN